MKTDLDLYLYALGQMVLIIMFCWSTCRIILWIVYRIWKHDPWIDASKPPKHDNLILIYHEDGKIGIGWYDSSINYFQETCGHLTIAVKWRELPYPKEKGNEIDRAFKV